MSVLSKREFPADQPAPELPFLPSGSPLAALIRAFDWGSTPLGPIELWPHSLRTSVDLILRSHVPIVSLWGDDGVMIYNDAYAVFAGGRHPELLGSKVLEGWHEVADFNAHVLEVGLAGGVLSFRDQELVLYRHGRAETIWADLDYSPVFDEGGKPFGIIAIVVETTERVLAQRWQAAEQERLQLMFEQAPGFMAMLQGPEHRFVLTNPRYQELAGHRDILGKPIAEALPDAVDQGFGAMLDQVFASGKAVSAANVLYARQLSPAAPIEERYVDFVYQPVRDGKGEVVGIFVQGSDVTDRREAERRLVESEARNRQIIDSAFDYAIIATDLDGRITRWNRGAEHLLGWTEDEAQGCSIAMVLTPEDREARLDAQERGRALASGHAVTEGWRQRRDGGRFWASAEVTPVRDERGDATGFVKVLRDRTEAHQAGLQLTRAQEAGGVGIFTLDLASNVLTATPQLCRIYGLPETATIDVAAIERLVSRDDAPKVLDARRRSAGEAPVEVEYRVRRASDGAERIIYRKAEYERDASGAPVRLTGVVQDITERRAAETALQASQAQFGALAQAIPNLAWTASARGDLQWFNNQVFSYSGASAQALEDGGWVDWLHPDDLVRLQAAYAAVLVSGADFKAEHRLRSAQGEWRWHLSRAVAVRGPDGAISGWIGTSTDIHEQKLAEMESSRERDRLWSLSQDLMVVCDEEGRITAVNPSATRLLGWTEAELLGAKLVSFAHPEDVEPVGAEVSALAQGKASSAFESRWETKAGDHRLIAWSAVSDNGAIHAVGRDVTEHRAVEDALRQSQKMEAVGQLTGGIAHDFNNLLQGITGSLDLIQKRLAQGRLGEIDRFVTGAVTSANRASALTHRLLAFSRRQPLDPRPVRANPLVASMDDLLRRTLGERVELELVLAGGLWLTKCDPNQLESALLNLAINARDAMPDGGKLTIETCNAHLDQLYAARQRDVRPGQYVCICVTDTGVGMDSRTVERAFEPFFTTKPIGQGTGLGLSMIYGFAQQSQGYAKIYSEVGKGTTFKLYLPRFRGEDQADEEEVATLTKAHLAEQGETVLVVEDEPVVRGLIVEVLNELGYHAIEAADGQQGIDVLHSRRRIDLLITDIGLPGLNGRQVADAGRVRRPGLKVLFMTGYAENAALASGFLEPGMAMITKPFAMENLATRIREIITGEES